MSLNKVFLALDQMSIDEIKEFLSNSPKPFPLIKIGLELFLKHGPQIVHEINSINNGQIFLDLKLHVIPVTVAKSIQSLQGLPIHFLTIHLSGGKEMITEALKAQREYLPHTKILGVSYLTSLSNENGQELFGYDLNELAFSRMFKLASMTNIHGIVCSPSEVKLLKSIDSKILTITPGVRFSDEIKNNQNIGDQKRVLSIEEAFQNGSDFVVMGRSLTKTSNVYQLNERLKIIEAISI